MKKLIIISTLLTVLFLVMPVYAQTEVTNGRLGAVREKLEQNTAQREAKITQAQERVATTLKKRAEKELDRRIRSLNGLITKINSFKKLGNSQKSTLVAQIQTEVTNLTALKAKIEADTDNLTLKTDVQSITKGFRIYAFFVPKIHVLATADTLDNVSDKMESLLGKLETRIAEAKVKGLNTASLDIILTDLKAKIADARIQAQAAKDLVIPLTPDGYPGNKTVLQSARAKLVVGHKNLQLAKKDIQKIIKDLRVLNKESSASTTTSSTTTTTTP
ncbi:MAG: hypothetical protein CO135_01305 [Candidatus Levybacteria bacterium CG_4_9_14_3_um_filter_35_16]|nr:MAG: hypothetical protein COW87_02480 [Candidatus Levybacteria bacterium CG22_combo_CG10-13_8_21_14_all_35_11]PIY94135.1 MAG: hypothetical protein COY68_03890 [Candidatus Levybacteria bacterium CG_4_10_14_0_8_um_filter_35_23]PJA91416.1 MAG: hypothetical protein CO135_01305 [Candidatus Levybacteria bacterium CG_4_9_14_3_um_filter_35_16]PJC54207.1 MAG: hypothetical protein CO028_03670 [Candidatus Levybacteria bacterium CG_4_9_14_0_2_um_filter_35_21]